MGVLGEVVYGQLAFGAAVDQLRARERTDERAARDGEPLTQRERRGQLQLRVRKLGVRDLAQYGRGAGVVSTDEENERNQGW
jgi:hypothetical protein